MSYYAGEGFAHQLHEKRVRPFEELSAEITEVSTPKKTYRGSEKEDEAFARLDAEIEKLRIRRQEKP